jgi:hypothetical protein
MITHHDYDADGTIRDEMLDMQEQDRKDEMVRVRFLRRLVPMTEQERTHLLKIETQHELRGMWETAMRERLTDVAATIEVLANSQGDY